ncbi:hypothetical protein Tco_1388563 [Tanacetum coccineum]
MGEPLSPDHVFDFPMDEPESHPAYDFFAPRPLALVLMVTPKIQQQRMVKARCNIIGCSWEADGWIEPMADSVIDEKADQGECAECGLTSLLLGRLALEFLLWRDRSGLLWSRDLTICDTQLRIMRNFWIEPVGADFAGHCAVGRCADLAAADYGCPRMT